MQLISIKIVTLSLILLSSCQSSSESSYNDISGLAGVWESTIITGSNENSAKASVILNIEKDGSGSFKSNETSGGVYEFDFEILVGAKKMALFVNDGRQFIYNYDFSNDKLQLESVTSDIIITLERK